MSYGSNLTKEEMQELNKKMKRKIEKGTIVQQFGMKFKLLEDSIAHGCPLVEIIEVTNSRIKYKKGDEAYVTLYLHCEGQYMGKGMDVKQL